MAVRYYLITDEGTSTVIGINQLLLHEYKECYPNLDQNISSYKYYIELYNDWFSFHQNKDEITFNEWCILSGKQYSWGKAYYYKK